MGKEAEVDSKLQQMPVCAGMSLWKSAVLYIKCGYSRLLPSMLSIGFNSGIKPVKQEIPMYSL